MPAIVIPPKPAEPRPDRRAGWVALAVSLAGHGLLIAAGLSAQFSHHPIRAVGTPEPVSVEIITETRPKELAPEQVTATAARPEAAPAVPPDAGKAMAAAKAEQIAAAAPPSASAPLPSEPPAQAAGPLASDAAGEVAAPPPEPSQQQPDLSARPAAGPPKTTPPIGPDAVAAAHSNAEELVPTRPPQASARVDDGEMLQPAAPTPGPTPEQPPAPASAAAEGSPSIPAAAAPAPSSTSARPSEVAAAPPGGSLAPSDAPPASARVEASEALGSEAAPEEQHAADSTAPQIAAAEPEALTPGVSPEAAIAPDRVAPDAAPAVGSIEAPPAAQNPPEQAATSPGPKQIAAAEQDSDPLQARIVPETEVTADRTAPVAAESVDAAAAPRAQPAAPVTAIAGIEMEEPAATPTESAPTIASIIEAAPTGTPVAETGPRLAPTPGTAVISASPMSEVAASPVTGAAALPEAPDRPSSASAVEAPTQANAAAPPPIVTAANPIAPPAAKVAERPPPAGLPESASTAPEAPTADIAPPLTATKSEAAIGASPMPNMAASPITGPAEITATPAQAPLAAAEDAQSQAASVGAVETAIAATPGEPQAATAAAAPEVMNSAAAPQAIAGSTEATVALPADAASPSANPAAPARPPAAIASAPPSALTSAESKATRAEIATAAPDVITGTEPGSAAAPAVRPLDADNTVAVIPPPTGPEPVDPDARIDALLKGLKCARVESAYALRGGNVELSGHVKTDADRGDLLAQIAQIPGVKTITDANLYIVGEPYCDVLTLLARADRSREQRGDIKEIGNPAQAGVMRLTRGEPVKLQLKAPDFAAFLYVDYFSSDGKVFHLVPNRDYGDGPFTPGERFGLGNPGDPGPQVRVAPPFGLDMIVALGSSERLFTEPRPPAEDAHAYLAALAATIDRVKQDNPQLKLEYAYHLIFTSEAASQ